MEELDVLLYDLDVWVDSHVEISSPASPNKRFETGVLPHGVDGNSELTAPLPGNLSFAVAGGTGLLRFLPGGSVSVVRLLFRVAGEAIRERQQHVNQGDEVERDTPHPLDLLAAILLPGRPPRLPKRFDAFCRRSVFLRELHNRNVSQTGPFRGRKRVVTLDLGTCSSLKVFRIDSRCLFIYITPQPGVVTKIKDNGSVSTDLFQLNPEPRNLNLRSLNLRPLSEMLPPTM